MEQPEKEVALHQYHEQASHPSDSVQEHIEDEPAENKPKAEETSEPVPQKLTSSVQVTDSTHDDNMPVTDCYKIYHDCEHQEESMVQQIWTFCKTHKLGSVASLVLVLLLVLFLGLLIGLRRSHNSPQSFNNNDDGEPTIVEGRPFREYLNSPTITAQVTSDCGSKCPWTLDTTLVASATTIDIDNVEEQARWAHQATGEHASIASFAAFTIALLTHQAPPDLIQASLAAAQDEVRHAQIAFAKAGGTRQNLGPTALPESHIHFVYNFTALALATAQEGCIDETLSALDLAHRADEASSSSPSFSLPKNDRDLLWTMAQDESKHAQLAWRTLHWICTWTEEEGDDACRTSLETVLRPTALINALELRFGDQRHLFDKAWEDIISYLIPLLSPSNKPIVSFPSLLPSATRVGDMAMDIIRGFCQSIVAA